MRKRISMLLVIVILITNLSAFAEQEEQNEGGGLLGAIGGFVTDTINNAGDAIGDAASGVSGLINGAGDSIGNALGDAGKGFLEFWKNTGAHVGDAWNWAGVSVAGTGSAINDSARNTLNQLKSWLDISGDNALNALKGVFGEVGSSLGMAGGKVTELWDSIRNYAEARNINTVVLVKLAIAIMIRVKLKDNTALGIMAGNYIDEIVMDWFDDFSISSDKAAENALATLDDSLENAVQGSQN